MLQATFQHLPRVAAGRERLLWKSQVLSWANLRKALAELAPAARGLGHDELLSCLDESAIAWSSRDASFFARLLPAREHYRLALEYPNETLFLDTETTGLSHFYHHLTLIGWSFGSRYGCLIRGQDPAPFFDILKQAKVLITFNGSQFDLPFIRREYPTLTLPPAHVDLRFFSRRAGLSGGQKAIEHLLGIERPSSVAEIDGHMAPTLWHRFCRGETAALELLTTYNWADIEGMKRIFEATLTDVMSGDSIPRRLQRPTTFPRSLGIGRKTKMMIIRTGQSSVSRPVEPRIRVNELLDPFDRPPIVVGIDLSGSAKRPTGWCYLNGLGAETAVCTTDEDILSRTIAARPDVVSIDSPLSLPVGRERIDDQDPTRKRYGITRLAERELRRRGVNVYPCLLPSMQQLTARGMRIASALRAAGVAVIESYPGAAQDILGLPRKRASLEWLGEGLARLGLSGPWESGNVTHDEIDAITSALVGLFFWAGRFEALGSIEENRLIVPDLLKDGRAWRERTVVALSGPIAAGKTTTAGILVKSGFGYGRFSQVLEDILRQQGEEPTRQRLQEYGLRIHHHPGQEWLVRELVRRLPPNGPLVIDGLRHPQDHSVLVESFGPALHHVHITAGESVRSDRYRGGASTSVFFREANEHGVERGVETTGALAEVWLSNEGSIDDLSCALAERLTAWSTADWGRSQCQ